MTRPFNVGDIVPWYTGISRKHREKRLALALQFYADESGNDTPPVYVLAGFFATPDTWLSFSERWQDVLDDAPSIKRFKMSEAMHRAGDFRHFSRSERDDRIVKFADVIAQHEITGIAVSVRHDDYERIVKGKLSPEYDDAYLVLFDGLMQFVNAYTENHGLIDAIDYVFDSRHDKEWMHVGTWDRLMESMGPERAARYASTPVFMNEERALPLQAADMLAWHIRRAAADKLTIADVSKAGPALAKRFSRGVVFDERYLTGAVTEIIEGFRLQGELPPHPREKIKEVAPALITLQNWIAVTTQHDKPIIALDHLPASGTGRYRLLHKCDRVGSPHLHRGSNNECLEGTTGGYVWAFGLSLRSG